MPLVLIPLVQLTSYFYPVAEGYGTEIIEEVVKALIIFFLIFKLPTKKQKILAGILFGFLFGLSESLFYLNNIFQLGDFSVFWQRILWAVPIHIITVLVMVFSGLSKKWWLIFGLAGAIILHILFNGIVVELLM